ncbi:MAG: DUF4271 domain-containing protein [bacterium]
MSRMYASPDTTADRQSIAFPQTVYAKSAFTAHHLRPTDFQTKKIDHFQPDWVLAILVFCFILLAWVQFFYPKRIQQIFRAPFSRRFINQLTRDGNLFRERITIAMGMIFLFTCSLFLYEFNRQILGFSFKGISAISLYGLITILIICFLAAKVALMRFLGAIFKTRGTTNNYLLNQLIFALVTGPVLLTVLVFIVYLNVAFLLYICLSLLVALLLFGFVRGFFIGMTLTKFSYLFLFVYLCSLEILPLLVLLKILIIFTKTAGA